MFVFIYWFVYSQSSLKLNEFTYGFPGFFAYWFTKSFAISELNLLLIDSVIHFSTIRTQMNYPCTRTLDLTLLINLGVLSISFVVLILRAGFYIFAHDLGEEKI